MWFIFLLLTCRFSAFSERFFKVCEIAAENSLLSPLASSDIASNAASVTDWRLASSSSGCTVSDGLSPASP
jgi:hypothetical protein